MPNLPAGLRAAFPVDRSVPLQPALAVAACLACVVGVVVCAWQGHAEVGIGACVAGLAASVPIAVVVAPHTVVRWPVALQAAVLLPAVFVGCMVLVGWLGGVSVAVALPLVAIVLVLAALVRASEGLGVLVDAAAMLGVVIGAGYAVYDVAVLPAALGGVFGAVSGIVLAAVVRAVSMRHAGVVDPFGGSVAGMLVRSARHSAHDPVARRVAITRAVLLTSGILLAVSAGMRSPLWIGMTAFATLHVEAGVTHAAAATRIGATIAGSLVALALIAVAPLAVVTAIMLGGLGIAIVWVVRCPAAVVVAITPIVLLAASAWLSSSLGSWALVRIVDITVGSGIAVVAHLEMRRAAGGAARHE